MHRNERRIESLRRSLVDEVVACMDLKGEQIVSITIHANHVEAVVLDVVAANGSYLGYQPHTRTALIETY